MDFCCITHRIFPIDFCILICYSWTKECLLVACFSGKMPACPFCKCLIAWLCYCSLTDDSFYDGVDASKFQKLDRSAKANTPRCTVRNPWRKTQNCCHQIPAAVERAGNRQTHWKKQRTSRSGNPLAPWIIPTSSVSSIILTGPTECRRLGIHGLFPGASAQGYRFLSRSTSSS